MSHTKRKFDAIACRPALAGRSYAVSSGRYLATAAAQRILEAGGNAIDAGVSGAMALSILYPDVVSFAGVAPTLVWGGTGAGAAGGSSARNSDNRKRVASVMPRASSASQVVALIQFR